MEVNRTLFFLQVDLNMGRIVIRGLLTYDIKSILFSSLSMALSLPVKGFSGTIKQVLQIERNKVKNLNFRKPD